MKIWSSKVTYMWSHPYVKTCTHTMQPIGLFFWQPKWYAAKLLKISSSTEKRHEDVDKSWGNCCGGGGWRREGESERGGGVIVEKLDIASLLHLTPSTSDLLDITECTYCKDSNDQHPHPNANWHFSIFIYNFQDASRSINLSREWIKL